MEAVEVEEIEVPNTPSPRTKNKKDLSRTPSVSPPESPTQNKTAPLATANGDDDPAEDTGGGGQNNSQTSPLGTITGKLGSLQLKKQYSKIFRIKTKVSSLR